MKVIIAGGRDFHDMHGLEWAIEMCGFKITEVVSGGCRGADKLGELWAERFRRPVKYFPADWKKHGKAAGPIRNREMAQYADALIALPGGAGTHNMVTAAIELGLPVMHVEIKQGGSGGYHAAMFNADKWERTA